MGLPFNGTHDTHDTDDSRRNAAVAVLPLPLSGGMVARVKRGLRDAPRAVSGLPGSAVRMSIKLRASVAEFLLVSHLRARSQPARSRDRSPDVIQRGAKIIDVTCKNWFAAAVAKRASPAYRTLI